MDLDDEREQQLRRLAAAMGVSLEAVVEKSIDDYVRRQSVEKAADYVLQKNAELYRLLAEVAGGKNA
jgi:predicted transcriptional regulator